MENATHFLLFILLQVIVSTEGLAAEEDSPSRSAYFATKENKRLKGHVVKRFESPSLLSCSHPCMTTEWCTSTNFKLYTKADSKGTCELNAYTFIDDNTDFHEEEGVTFSMLLKPPCNGSSCQNNGKCVAGDYSRNIYHCVCKPGFAGLHCEACNFVDFEGGINGWEKTGTAFNNQPTYGDNPTARNRDQPANQQGEWWIGGAEDRPNKAAPAGRTQGDGPQGTLTSPIFNIRGQSISFLIGGGCDITFVRAELVIDGQVAKKETGNCNETMYRKTWDVTAFIGQSARVRLVDASSGVWGHINFDDLKGDISCEEK